MLSLFGKKNLICRLCPPKNGSLAWRNAPSEFNELQKLFDALKTSSPTDDCNACCDDCITGQDVSTNDFDIGIHRYSSCSWKTAKAVDVIRAIIESRQTASDIWKDMPLNELMSLSNYVLLSLIPNTHTHTHTHTLSLSLSLAISNCTCLLFF
mgnify:CR=1 FL=1